MKKKIYILALIVTLLSSVYTSKAEAIVTFTDSDLSRYYYDDVEKRKATVSINVDGIVESTGQKILIRGTTHILSDPFDKVTKKELLDSIRHQMTELQLDYKYELLDFASDAKLYNNGELLFSVGDDEGTVRLKGDIRKYQLNGHVILREKKEPELKNPANFAQINYKVKFARLGNFIGRPLETIQLESVPISIGQKINSQQLRNLAEEILAKKYPKLQIRGEVETIITHNSNGDFQKYFSEVGDFSYTIAPRNRIIKTNSKSGFEEEFTSIDEIYQVYYVDFMEK
ncbi:hypothetical protein EQF93_07800 [Helcococcus ovis]|uniref:staphylokinase domain-containing protein n=1 Tax=Helcococcus ovis TaxID=72026 RepID=UPI00106FA736|nr:staphylokinase domain-containing protein [Helcococcus ovis]TFF65994.1 hypothetical protein EQF93_07800 [Helcococcus ovis]WNZ01266.1 staphylokinase domain-containing protein [Helcococcus ovis]